MTIIAEFDRKQDNVYGTFSIYELSPKGEKKFIFKDLPASSGQRAFTQTDWVAGKSPTPYGEHYLMLKQEVLQMEPKGTPFFRICTDPSFPRLLKSSSGKIRQDVGLHLENQYPGTAGCVALLCNDAGRKKLAYEVFDYLKTLGKTWPYIKLRVI